MKTQKATYENKTYRVFEFNCKEMGFHRVILVPMRYPNGNLAIQALSVNRENVPTSIFGVLTVNMEQLPEGYAYVKNYSENTEWAEFLARKIGKDTGKKRQTGYVEIPLYSLDINKVYAK